MFDIQSDNHLGCNNKKLIKTCVECFRSIDSSLNQNNVKKFVKDIIVNYFSSNNFHNFKHAFEVFQMVFYLQKFNKSLSKEDRKLLLITALCHDINHIGYTNKTLGNDNWKNDDYDKKLFFTESFYMRRSSTLYSNSECEQSPSIRSRTESEKEMFVTKANIEARLNADMLYNDTLSNGYSSSYDENFHISNNDSYNEEVHIRQTFVIMAKHMKKILRVNTLSDIDCVHNRIVSMILATDLKLHNKYMRIINAQHDESSLVQMILILKLADISHPLRPFPVHCYWVFKLLEENDNNKETSLSFIIKDTIHFINFFVTPLLNIFIEKHKKNNDGELTMLSDNLNDNLQTWSTHIL